MERIERKSSSPGPLRASTADQVASSAHQAIDQLSATARPTVMNAASSAHHLVDRIAGTTNRVAHQLEQTATRLKNVEQRLVDASSSYVREHPFKSAGIALATGFLVSRLVGSHRDKHAESAEDGVLKR